VNRQPAVKTCAALGESVQISSLAMIAVQVQRHLPRLRGIAGGAAILSFILHGIATYLLWHASDEPITPQPLPEKESVFFLELLPDEVVAHEALAPASTRSERTATPPVSSPARVPQDELPAPTRRQASPNATPKHIPSVPKKPGNPPRKPASAPVPASVAPEASLEAIPTPDFRWRAEDAAGQGRPRARGEPTVILKPKAKAEPSALAKGIANSARPSCSDAKTGMGLLALPFLLADTLRDEGCKW